MYITSHKQHELREKLASLEREFDDWRRLSEADEALEKHHTQIRRVTNRLDGARMEIGESVGALGAGVESLARAPALLREILAVHRVWDFFRGKLALRCVELFGPYLRAADEFAWACYRPAQTRVDPAHIHPDDIKEPPLVFFNGGMTPLTLPRKFAFWAERVPLEEIEKPKLLKILAALPVPVVGIPWFQVRHLPDALTLAHEVGHIVMSDFGLSSRSRSLLDEAMTRRNVHDGRRDAWRSWLKEVFADIYGVLAVGPAFVEVLIDSLADAPEAIAAERRTSRGWKRHPPAHLRILLNLEALAALGFGDEAARLKAHWRSVYASHAMVGFDCNTLVQPTYMLTR